MTQTLIENLEALPLWMDDGGIGMVKDERGTWVNYDDLSAIIEQHKRESEAPLDYVHNMPGASGFTVCVFRAERVPCGTPIYLAQPSHTKLIGELVEVLEAIGRRFVSGNDVPVSRASVTAEEWQPVQDLVAKAREAIKHD